MGNFNKKRGYSLIETVVYIALITIMLIISTSSIISIYRTFGVLRTERKISINAESALETMIRDIRSATSASVPAADALTLTTTAGSIIFSRVGTQLMRQDGANPQQAITGSDVRVINLAFLRARFPISESEALKSMIITINMTIEAGSGSFIKSVPYTASAVLRGVY